MRPLPIQFAHNGFEFQQVERREDVAIYRQSKRGRTVAFEVVCLRIAPARRFQDGRQLPEREVYPANEHWGLYGFTCQTLERAKHLMHGLLECPPFSIQTPKSGFLSPPRVKTGDGGAQSVLQDGSEAA